MKWCSFLVVLALSSEPASANDYYVDSVFGDDANSGLSPGDPWLHVSFALAQVPDGEHTVHLAPGIYGSGEFYPLPVRNGITVVGDEGSAVTILEGGWFEASGTEPVYSLRARGLTLRNGDYGVYILRFHKYDVDVELTDVRIDSAAIEGICVDAYTSSTTGNALCRVILEDVHVSNCLLQGLDASTTSLYGVGRVFVRTRDCSFIGNGATGASTSSVSGLPGGSNDTRHLRGRFLGNRFGLASSVFSTSSDPPSFTFELMDSLVAGNSRSGLVVDSGSVEGCTITGNGEEGVLGGCDLMGSIVQGNGDDLSDSFTGSVNYCCIDDPDTPPGVGNIAADALFLDPAAGDYRLTFHSPCVDAGDPSSSAGFDLNGVRRSQDGNLDAVEAPDMGAFELAPLATQDNPVTGRPLRLELWGPAGASVVVFGRRGSLSTPVPTPFGTWRLGTGREALATGSAAPGPPGLVLVDVPDVPALVGFSLSFQALTASGSVSPPVAFTNAITLAVEE